MTALTFGPWQEVLACVLVGITIGLGLMAWRRTMRRTHAEHGDSAAGVHEASLQLADARELYQRAIARLRELHEQAHELDEAYVAEEGPRQELRAAQLLKELQTLETHQATQQAREHGHEGNLPHNKSRRSTRRGRLPAFMHQHPKFVGVLWGVGLSVVLSYLFTTVREGSTPRPSLPMAAPAEAAQGGPQMDRARFDELQQAITANPNDIKALLELAHMLLRVQLLDEAKIVNDRALQLDGNNLEALTHAAVLAAGRGEAEGAQAGLAMVLKKDPGFAEAWFFRGMLSMQSGDMPTMQESLQQFVRLAPDGPQKERVRAMLARSQASAAPGN